MEMTAKQWEEFIEIHKKLHADIIEIHKALLAELVEIHETLLVDILGVSEEENQLTEELTGPVSSAVKQCEMLD